MTDALLFLAGAVLSVLAARWALDQLAHRFHWRIGWLSKLLPGWRQIGCGRCGTSWRYSVAHVTAGKTARGTFAMAPLCDPCWRELGTPAARAPFYEAEYAMRRAQGDATVTAEKMVAIRAALATGL